MTRSHPRLREGREVDGPRGVGIASASGAGMYERRLLLAGASVMVALQAAPAAANDPPAVRVLLADPTVLARWLSDRDPIVAVARQRLDAASEQRAQASTFPNPQLAATVGGFVVGETNPNIPRLGIGQTTNVTGTLSELVELGKRGPRQRAASLRVEAAAQIRIASLGGRIGDATLALGKLAYVNARRAAVAANLQAARTLEALEKVRRDHADLSGAEFARIELETQQLSLQLERADADIAVAISQCTAVLRARCPNAEPIDASALDMAAPIPSTLAGAAAIDPAIERRPARAAARFEAAALNADATLAGRRAIPDVTLGLGYTFDNLTVAGNQHQTLLVSIGIPLPLFDRGNHDAAAARAASRAVLAEQQAAGYEAHGQVEALFAQRTNLESTLAKLETDAVPKSTQIVQQTRRAFDLGQAGLAELLLAERAHRQLLLDVLDTRFESFNVRAQLRQTLGLDDEAARSVESRR